MFVQQFLCLKLRRKSPVSMLYAQDSETTFRRWGVTSNTPVSRQNQTLSNGKVSKTSIVDRLSDNIFVFLRTEVTKRV